MLTQLVEIQNLPSKKRKEENHKFVFKRFFKYLQKTTENPEDAFQIMITKYLAFDFTKKELAIYFRPSKDVRFSYESRKLAKDSYYIPCKLNKEFLKRILKIDSIRKEIEFYLVHILPGQVKIENRDRIVNFMLQFQKIFIESDEFGIFSDAIVNSVVCSRHKNLWSIGEVNYVIQEIRKKMEKIELSKTKIT